MMQNLIQKKFKRVDKERVIYYPHKEEPVYDETGVARADFS